MFSDTISAADGTFIFPDVKCGKGLVLATTADSEYRCGAALVNTTPQDSDGSATITVRSPE